MIQLDEQANWIKWARKNGVDEYDDQGAMDKHTTASNVNAGHSYERMRTIHKVGEGTAAQVEGGRTRPFGHEDGNLEKQGPPGPPPRPGLTWNQTTHRWVRPHHEGDVKTLSSEQLQHELKTLLDELPGMEIQLREMRKPRIRGGVATDRHKADTKKLGAEVKRKNEAFSIMRNELYNRTGEWLDKEGGGGGIAGPGDGLAGADVHTPVGGSVRSVRRKKDKARPVRMVKAVRKPGDYDMFVVEKQFTGAPRDRRFVVAGYASPVVVDLEGHRIGHEALKADLPRFLADDGKYANANVMHCLVPETEVLVKRGGPGEYKAFKRIDEVREGDRVYTHKGRKRTVNQVAKFWKDEEIVELELSNGVVVKITGDHKVLTTKGWIEAGQLTVEHVLMHAKPRGPQSEATRKKIGDAHRGRKHWWKPGPNAFTTGEAARVTADQRRGKTWAEVYGEEKATAKREKHKLWRGDKHPNWRGGASGGKYNWDFQKVRKDVLKRDGHACVRCGITAGEVRQNNGGRSGLHVDHINSIKIDDRLDNLQALCPSCHTKKTRVDDRLVRDMVLANGVKILDVRRLFYKGWTYCLNVDEDHSYVGNGIVYHNSNVTIGRVLPEFTAADGKVYRTEVDDVGLFAVVEVRTDEAAPAVCAQVIDDVEAGVLRSFSISGNASNPRFVCEGDRCFYDIGELQLLEITLCEEGVNQDAKFEVIAKALRTGGYFGLRTIYKRAGPPSPGLVPQSGDPAHPVRWVRPNDVAHAEGTRAAADIGGVQAVGARNVRAADRELERAGLRPVTRTVDKITKDGLKAIYEDKKPPVVGDTFIDGTGFKIEITNVSPRRVNNPETGDWETAKGAEVTYMTFPKRGVGTAGTIYLDEVYGDL